jgi:hypothetical protein
MTTVNIVCLSILGTLLAEVISVLVACWITDCRIANRQNRAAMLREMESIGINSFLHHKLDLNLRFDVKPDKSPST